MPPAGSDNMDPKTALIVPSTSRLSQGHRPISDLQSPISILNMHIFIQSQCRSGPDDWVHHPALHETFGCHSHVYVNLLNAIYIYIDNLCRGKCSKLVIMHNYQAVLVIMHNYQASLVNSLIMIVGY